MLFVLIWVNIDNIFGILPNGEVYEAGKWVVFFIGLGRLVATTLGFGATLISFSRYYYWGLYFTFFLTALTIGFNLIFIPYWGMTGAALATFLSSILGYSFQQWIVLKKIGANPYSWGTLMQVGLILLFLGANELLPQWTDNPFVDGIYRTGIIGSLWLFLLYRLKVSDEVCALIRKGLHFKNPI
jgi:O-antigen/teichoic acid export membrane protein